MKRARRNRGQEETGEARLPADRKGGRSGTGGAG